MCGSADMVATRGIIAAVRATQREVIFVAMRRFLVRFLQSPLARPAVTVRRRDICIHYKERLPGPQGGFSAVSDKSRPVLR